MNKNDSSVTIDGQHLMKLAADYARHIDGTDEIPIVAVELSFTPAGLAKVSIGLGVVGDKQRTETLRDERISAPSFEDACSELLRQTMEAKTKELSDLRESALAKLSDAEKTALNLTPPPTTKR